MRSRFRGAVAALLVACLLSTLHLTTGCAAGSKATYASAPMTAPAAAPEPLQQSVFSKDPDGSLTEEALQKILDAPLDFDFPGRVGVLPIITAKDWRGPNPNYDQVPVGVGAFVKTLRGSTHFTMITEVMPIPSGALGMEALREISARYRLRYLILYREQIVQRTRQNGWTVGYFTLVGSLFLPGQNLHADGYIEASLFDVKTGLFLYTVRRRVSASVTSNVWHTGDKINNLQARLAIKFAPDLAKDVKSATANYEASVKVENGRKFAAYEERLEEERNRPAPVEPPPADQPPAGPDQPASHYPSPSEPDGDHQRQPAAILP